MRKVIYTPLALSDITEAISYLAIKLASPQAAQNLLTSMKEAIQQILSFPYACELYRPTHSMQDEIRQMPIRNYVLYYAVFEDRIEIRRFLHGRQNRSNLFF